MAELLQTPTKHYKSVSKFLRAFQRVLSVSSPVTAFPLPPSTSDIAPSSATFTLGSDESLGGALLSPIPWLTPSSLAEDTGTSESGDSGSVINGVMQNELLRQEQELGIVPAVQGIVGHGDEFQMGTPPPLGPEDVGPQPEGTVFPDPPRTPEEARSPPFVMGLMSAGIDTAMREGAGKLKEEEGEGEEEMDEKADEKEKEEEEEEEDDDDEEGGKREKKDDMEVDGREERAKELEDKMQLDAASDGRAEAAHREAAS